MLDMNTNARVSPQTQNMNTNTRVSVQILDMNTDARVLPQTQKRTLMQEHLYKLRS